MRPGRRLAPGTVLYAGTEPSRCRSGRAPAPTGARLVRALVDDLSAFGNLALPPYIRTPLGRPRPLPDGVRRQGRQRGRPHRGLAPDRRRSSSRVRRAGRGVAHLDLAVGLGTFRPIKDEQVEEHTMHAERYSVPAATWEACQQASACRSRRDDDSAGPGIGRRQRALWKAGPSCTYSRATISRSSTC